MSEKTTTGRLKQLSRYNREFTNSWFILAVIAMAVVSSWLPYGYIVLYTFGAASLAIGGLLAFLIYRESAKDMGTLLSNLPEIRLFDSDT